MRIFTVDAFADKPFGGNPAGVCIYDEGISEDLFPLIAREIKYSETAFVTKIKNAYRIRWFTPKTEVNLCGHATLAAAQVLYEYRYCDPAKNIDFGSKSGRLTAKKAGDKIELDFPQRTVKVSQTNDVIENAFNIKPVFVGKDDNRYLIEIDSDNDLLSIKPDFQILKASDLGRFIITARSTDPKYDFVSRYFAPAAGVLEDPVTGSAHCYLAPYWGKKLAKRTMTGFQASERSGIVECELAEGDRVLLRGQAVVMHELVPKWKQSQILKA